MTEFVLGALFSLVGIAAFRYGRKNEDPRSMIIGGLLMIYPYFVPGSIWIAAVGTVLSIGLFVGR